MNWQLLASFASAHFLFFVFQQPLIVNFATLSGGFDISFAVGKNEPL